MATLLLTAVGTALGGPLGGAIGALVGRQADNLILGVGSRQGPRLRELSVSTSSYGQAMPRHFGRIRTAGTIIWSTDLIENRRRQGGGKGRPSSVSYTYSVSFAVALSSTPLARLGRIWADGNLLRGTDGDLKAEGSLRFYCGFGDDPVDPMIQADKGAAASAFRDCAYVVFEDLQLAEFGNRIPALNFEIFGAGSDNAVSLEQLVPVAASPGPHSLLSPAMGYSDEGGALAASLSAISEVMPLICTSGHEGLILHARPDLANATLLLPQQLVVPGDGRGTARQRQRAAPREREPLALRYYDEARDYQPGVQRALGQRRSGREQMVDLPATISAAGAKQLASDNAQRARWQQETLLWRIGELDPRHHPGTVVRLPDLAGQWLIRSWEWSDDGVALELERLAPLASAPGTADPGGAIAASDLPLPQTVLAAFETVSDGTGNPAVPLLFAAATAENNAWRGAALFSVQGDALAPLARSATRRAIIGTLTTPATGSAAMLLEGDATLDLVLTGQDLTFEDTDITGLAAGANRMMVGGEVLQFLRAEPIGLGHWRLRGLLRGRAGTEHEAACGHPVGTMAILLDDRLTQLDPLETAPGTRIAAMGIGDGDPVMADLANLGLSRRPPCPVHPRIDRGADGAWDICWTRRARGQWRWEDGVDAPLVEEREAYLVGYGPAEAAHASWPTSEPNIRLTSAERAQLLADHGAAALWVRQVGTAALSHPLLLASLP